MPPLWISAPLSTKKIKKAPRPGRGYSQKNCVGVCGPLPKTLALFITKICDFPYLFMTWQNIWYPIYDLTLTQLPKHNLWGFYCWSYLECIAGIKRERERLNSIRVYKNWYPIYDQDGGKMAKIDTLFMTKMAEKPYPLGPRIPI